MRRSIRLRPLLVACALVLAYGSIETPTGPRGFDITASLVSVSHLTNVVFSDPRRP